MCIVYEKNSCNKVNFHTRGQSIENNKAMKTFIALLFIEADPKVKLVNLSC